MSTAMFTAIERSDAECSDAECSDDCTDECGDECSHANLPIGLSISAYRLA